MATYDALAETPQSKIFASEAFGYWKVTVERPLRLHSQLSTKAIEGLRFASGDEEIRSALPDELGDALFEDFASVRAEVERRPTFAACWAMLYLKTTTISAAASMKAARSLAFAWA